MLAVSVGLPGVAAGTRRARAEELFDQGQGGFWLDFTDTGLLFQDTGGTTPVAADGDRIALAKDKSPNALDASQATAGIEPTFLGGAGAHIERSSSGGYNIEVSIPTGGIVGTLVIGTTDGTAAYRVSVPSGTWNLVKGPGEDVPVGEFSDDAVTGVILREGVMSGAEITAAVDYMVARGAKRSYAGEDDFDSHWKEWSEITHFPVIEAGACTDPEEAWRDCLGLVEFPALDLGAATSLNRAWRDCRNLPSIPKPKTTSALTNLGDTFKDCRVLEAVPAFENTENVTTLSEFCRNCYALTTMPWIDTSGVTDFYYAWRRCQSLTVFPELDFTQGQNFDGCWEDTAIVDFPSTATFPNATSCNSMCYDSPNLATFPAGAFDTTPATDFTLAFANCALDEASVDGIIVSIEAAATSNGTLDITGGTSAAPSSAVHTTIDALRGRGWTVQTNGY